jgi:Tfp pilus assembly protein PilF
VTLAVFWPALRYPFVNLDDFEYVTGNPHVQGGLTWDGVEWAFSNTKQAAYWAPLMWLSHMLAVQLFGLNPWGHHLVNLLLHALNVVLLFLVFQKMTGATWRSALLAALFGLHPLRVESVVWVTERKDVLSTLFWMLTLLAYVNYVQSAKGLRRKALWYVTALVMLGLGLMCKGMLVTIPCVLLLLDYWPLRRFKSRPQAAKGSGLEHFNCGAPPHPSLSPDGGERAGGGRLGEGAVHGKGGIMVEKIPFFIIAIAGSVVTFVVQKVWGLVPGLEGLSLGTRAANALVSYCRYLGKTLWPDNLAIFYPHPGQWPAFVVLWSGLVLGALSLAILATRVRLPFLLVGWLWFLGTLFPVSGVAQSGEQAIADRFTYVPSIGLFIMGIWGTYELTRCWQHHRLAISTAAAIVTLACILVTRHQLGYWKDDETLFRRAVQITENNHLAHLNLGEALEEKGQVDEAIKEFREALRIAPGHLYYLNTLGAALAGQGRTDEAISEFREAIRRDPTYAEAIYNLGNALREAGRIEEAISQYKEAIRLRPQNIEAHSNLGTLYAVTGEIDNAIREFQEAVRLNPRSVVLSNNLARAMAAKAAGK